MASIRYVVAILCSFVACLVIAHTAFELASELHPSFSAMWPVTFIGGSTCGFALLVAVLCAWNHWDEARYG